VASNSPPEVVGFWLAVGFLTVCVAIGLYDIWAIYTPGDCPTVSHYIQRWSKESPLLPLVGGMVLGHLFFATKG